MTLVITNRARMIHPHGINLYVTGSNHLHYSISGPMTGALVVYAITFMRYSLAVTPANYLLFACHLTNFGAQTTQGYRYLAYWKCVDPP